MSSRHVVRAVARTALAFAVLSIGAPVAPAGAVAPTSGVASAEGGVSAQAQTMLTAFDGSADDHFGSAVAISGDLMVIGAPEEDPPAGVNAGSIYVYERDGTSWDFDARLNAPDAAANDGFGSAVAVYDHTIVVGAHYDDSFRGSAYVFTENAGGIWSFQQKLQPAASTDNDHVGLDVALHQNTVVLGTWDEKAYVYVRSGTAWSQQGVLIDPTGGVAEWFGNNVALYGDTALVGADGDDSNRGSVVVFGRTGTAWTYRARLTASDRAVDDHFGYSVALYRDTALVGAPGDDDHGAVSGSVYLFGRSGTAWTQLQKIAPSDGAATDEFGGSASLSGETAVVGAVGDDSGMGSAYRLSRVTGSWTYVRMTAATRAADDHYGSAVAVCGGNIVIGAPHDDDVAANAGAVYHEFSAPPPVIGFRRVSGSNRYLTAVQCSKAAFPFGAPAVVLATGDNWPDALGGSALAGAVRGPILLTPKAALPAEVRAEIVRLGATRVFILGGTGAVSQATEDQLVALMGRYDVVRYAGATRYQTAELVAQATVDHMGSSWDRNVFVATGADFPDATAASPVAARLVIPVLLANPTSTYVYRPTMAEDAFILGGTAAVPAATEAALLAAYGAGHVSRFAGTNRYETAVLVAEAATEHDLLWTPVGLASGTSFADALAGGPLLAIHGSPVLLTDPSTLSTSTRNALVAHKTDIAGAMLLVGGTAAVSTPVETAARSAAGIP